MQAMVNAVRATGATNVLMLGGEEYSNDLSQWLTYKLRPMFGDRVLAVSEDAMLVWRLLVEDGRKTGHTFSQPDLIIAATALHHGFTIVTRDKSDFEKAGVPVVNPWEAT